MANTRETMGESACLDALVANTLTSFEDDGVKSARSYALTNRDALTYVKMDNCISIMGDGFSGCSNLEVVDIMGTGQIATSAFANCSKLKHLIMRGTSKTTASSAMFGRTPIGWHEGAIYVNSNLVNTYKEDSRWGSYIILPVSDYPASGLPENVADTWSQIIAASQNGTYSSKYSVGDIKSIVIDGVTYYMMLVAKDADVLASDGATTVPMTWIVYKKMYATNHRMNPSGSTQGTGSYGGWEYCEMRSWLNDTVLPLIPQEVQSAIKSVRKYSDNLPVGETTVTHDQQTSDKLWIPSAREVFGGTSYEQTGPIYSDVFNSNNSRAKFYQDGTTAPYSLRTAAFANGGDRFVRVESGGTAGYASPSDSFGVCFGFCI